MMITEFSVVPDLIQHEPKKNRLGGKGKDHEPLWIQREIRRPGSFSMQMDGKPNVKCHGAPYGRQKETTQKYFHPFVLSVDGVDP